MKVRVKGKPEGEVFFTPGADVEPQGAKADDHAGPERNELAQLPGDVGLTEDEVGQVHCAAISHNNPDQKNIRKQM